MAKQGILSAFAAVGLASSFFILPAQATPPTEIKILHTNDLHSRFRPEKTPLALGGVARLKTAIDRARAENPSTLLVDGGDWSEGSIYYTPGAGRETLKMMSHLTYDVAVVGNHDWLNGADTLLDLVAEFRAQNSSGRELSFIASNLKTIDYPRETEFRKHVLPYVIKEVEGIKIAFIGLATYEFIYDSFFLPIKITEPFSLTAELAKRLKKRADAVVVVSHNSIKLNRAVLKAAPDVDLVVGAHDHVKLTEPIVVSRPGAKPAWIVETGSWGRYLGHVKMKVTPRDLTRGLPSSVELTNYRLEQMDKSVREDEPTLKRIEALEAEIEVRRGPIFHDEVGETKIELSREGLENLMGDFTTDAYLNATGADLAIDHTNFIYGELHEGKVSSADLFDSNPGVYNPKNDKAWTLHIVPLKGRILKWVLNLYYASKSLSQIGPINFSGAELVFNPLLQTEGLGYLSNPFPGMTTNSLMTFEAPSESSLGLIIQSFKIRGEEVQSDRVYRLAAPGGLIDSFRFANKIIPGAIPLEGCEKPNRPTLRPSRELCVDTGQEDWRVMGDYLRAISPVTWDKVPFGSRVRTVQPDLGVLYSDVNWEPGAESSGPEHEVRARIRVRIRNNGTIASSAGTLANGPRVALLANQHGVNYSIEPKYTPLSAEQKLRVLAPGESQELIWNDVTLPRKLGVHAITVRILGTEREVNHSNDGV